MTNAEIADVLRQHADLLEIAGENRFRINAYRRAADTIRAHPQAVAREPDLTVISGVGAGIAAAVAEIVATGRYKEFEDLQEQLPGSLLTMLDVPGLGARRIERFYRELNISSLAELEEAAQANRLAQLKGIGPKAQESILAGIEFTRRQTGRLSIGVALPLARRLADQILQQTARPVWVAGSVRRMCESVGNIDLLVVSDDGQTTLTTIAALDAVAETLELSADSGRFMLHQGVALRVVVTPAERAGAELVRLTGSAAHVAALGTLQDAGTEEACYAALGLPWIAPELREDRGELEAARSGRLPRLIELADLNGDLHLHTTWSDGRATPLEMAQAAASRDYQYLAITDHSGGLGIANGLDAARLTAQMAEIRGLADSAPLRLLAGSEVEVHRDGRLDFEDALLDQLDLVVASLHSGLRQDTETVTARICATLRKRQVDIVAHATGRLIDRRQGASYDWSRVFEAARASGAALEMNSDPARLDLNEEHARAAHEAGVLLAIDSDAHRAESLDLVRYGIGIARRAWVEPQNVVNTWELDDLLAWLSERRTPER